MAETVGESCGSVKRAGVARWLLDTLMRGYTRLVPQPPRTGRREPTAAAGLSDRW